MKTITLCGSTKFKAEFLKLNETLTLEGNVVLMPGVFGHADGITLTPLQKEQLDSLHLVKISMSDEVHVVCPGGYIGESTRKEIAFAERGRKGVVLHNDPLEAPSDPLFNEWAELAFKIDQWKLAWDYRAKGSTEWSKGPPPGEEFVSATLAVAGGLEVRLSHIKQSECPPYPTNVGGCFPIIAVSVMATLILIVMAFHP